MNDKNYEGDKQIFKDEKSAKKALEEENGAFCFDCNCNIHLEEEEVKNGCLLAYEEEDEEEGEFFVFKCDDCFAKNKGLESYKKCEVYSRIVGYLRPVNQWNDGKKREYEERKEYKAPTDN